MSKFIKAVKRLPWSIISMIIFAINSFVTLLFRNKDDKAIVYIVIFMIIAYVVAMPILTFALRKRDNRKKILDNVNKGFRLFYTGVSLTVVVLNMVNTGNPENMSEFLAEQSVKIPVLIAVAVLGLSSFWLPKLKKGLLPLLNKNKKISKILTKLHLSGDTAAEEQKNNNQEISL